MWVSYVLVSQVQFYPFIIRAYTKMIEGLIKPVFKIWKHKGKRNLYSKECQHRVAIYQPAEIFFPRSYAACMVILQLEIYIAGKFNRLFEIHLFNILSLPVSKRQQQTGEQQYWFNTVNFAEVFIEWWSVRHIKAISIINQSLSRDNRGILLLVLVAYNDH